MLPSPGPTTALNSAANTANNSSLATSSVAPTATGALIVAFVMAQDTVAGGTFTDSLGAITFDLVREDPFISNDYIKCYVSNVVTPNTTARTYTWTSGGGGTNGIAIGVVQIELPSWWPASWVGSNAVRQTATQGFAASATPTVGLNLRIDPEAHIIVGLINQTNPAGVNAPAEGNLTAAFNLGFNTPTSGLRVQRMTGTSGCQTNTNSLVWGSTSASQGGAMVVEFKNANRPWNLQRGMYVPAARELITPTGQVSGV